MIDIVEKLHEHARCAETRYEIEMCDAAIKEITRLREEPEQLKDRLAHVSGLAAVYQYEDFNLRKERDILREENARLREALKPFADELKEQQVEVPHVTEGDSLIHSYTLRLKHLSAAAAAIQEGEWER